MKVTIVIRLDADVIVVGGGPAGSTAARFLADKGISTLLLDKAHFPRKKVCAAGLLEHTFRTFPEVKPFLSNYNFAVRVVSPNLETKFEVISETALMAMTYGRTDFDSQMLQLTKNAGAEIREGIKIIRAQVDNEKISLTDSMGENFSSKIVIGADSAYSTIAKSLHIGINSQDPMQMGIGIEKEFLSSKEEMDQFFTPGRRVTLYLHFKSILGYGWVFPRETSFNVGIGGGITQGNTLQSIFHEFITHLKSQQIIPNDIDDSSPDAALLPSTFPTRNCYSTRTLLIGDAGGFCSSATGEGIFYAMMSGKLVADACQQILAKNDFSLNGMSRFYSIWQKELGNELKFQYFAFQNVLLNERRCRAAVNWASQDKGLREIFMKFLTGQQTYRQLGGNMAWQYLRCKIKDKLKCFTKPQSDLQFEQINH